MTPRSRKVRATRAGGYHVRTGCKTCKVRHIKCDEEKPSCLQCRRAGWTCDGATNDDTPKPTAVAAAWVSRCRTDPTRVLPTFLLLGSDRERRSFEFFFHQIGKDLSDALRLDILRQLILQLSHSDPSIKKAVIALGSIGERLQINSILTLDNQQANACHEFAIQEYCKSLRYLRHQMQNEPNRAHIQTLVACLLFTVFEFLQGSEMGSLTHLQSGLYILHDIIPVLTEGSIQLDAWLDLGTDTIITRLPDHVSWKDDRLVVELVHTFTVIENQALFWLGLESWETPLLMGPQIKRLRPKHFDYFPTIEEAAVSLSYQINQMQDLRRSFITPSSYKQFDVLHTKRHDLIAQLGQWLVALNELRNRLGNSCDEHIVLRLNLMNMNHCFTYIMLESLSEQANRDVSETISAKFAEVISLAKSVLLPLDEHRLTRINRIVFANNMGVPNAMFSFYAGLIQPLYITASRCPDGDIAEEAILLLSTSPWREGAWESSTMAKIALRSRKRSEGMSVGILRGLKLLCPEIALSG